MPTAVLAAIASLQSAIAAATPLASQSLIGLAPVINAALALVQAVDAAIDSLAPDIDGFTATGAAPELVSAALGLYANAMLQSQLVVMRGYAGRVLLNLENATG